MTGYLFTRVTLLYRDHFLVSLCRCPQDTALPSLGAAVIVVAVVVVVESPQTPEDDPEKRLRTRWETNKLIDGLPKVQSLAVRVEGGTAEPQVVVRLIFIIAYPARSFFRSVDQMLPAAKSKVMSTTEASQMSHFGLGRIGVFSKNGVWRGCGSVERSGDEWSRTGTPNDGSAGGAV